MTQFRLGPPWFAVVGCMLLGLVIVLGGSVRTGGVIIALGLALGGGLRAVLPKRYVPDLAVRSRTFDVAAYLLLALTAFVAFTGVRLS